MMTNYFYLVENLFGVEVQSKEHLLWITIDLMLVAIIMEAKDVNTRKNLDFNC